MVTKIMKTKTYLHAMRIGSAVVFQLICAGLSMAADQKLPVLKVGTQVYSNVTITSVSATDIYFTYDKGAANAKLKNLEPALQKLFNFNPARANAASAASSSDQIIDRKNAHATMDDAIARVKSIVNQPVRQLRRTPDLPVTVFSPGWFHEGATKPDFNTVDIRTTQDTQTYRQPYVTSDLNPGVAFVGSETEFNPMTKYFYANLSLPKKRLTEAEMVEINRLYRIIGKCEEKSQPPSALVMAYVSAHPKTVIVAAVSLVALLLAVRVLRSRPVE
jgi:hypothetical protein